MTEDQIEALKLKIADLHVEHHDLDAIISRLQESEVYDELQLRRLKKRKLFLKDRIALLQRQLTPDVPA